MAKVTVYNQEGKKIGEESLDKTIFGLKANPDLIWQVVVAMQTNTRLPWAHTKDRSEVRGGGRKPWRQKGTGRARHGSIRSPIWIGGGVTFGPRKERVYKLKVNKKVKRQAMLMSLSDKVASSTVILLDELKLPGIKTKKMFEILQALNLRKAKKKIDSKSPKTKSTKEKTDKIVKEKIKSVLIITDKKDQKIIKSARNIPGLEVALANNLNLLQILKNQYLIITKKALAEIKKVYG